jgi:hypothetical protein
MLRRAFFILIGVLLNGCASSAVEPIVITATGPAESPTPHVIVVTATEKPEVTVTSQVTPRPTPTPKPQWQPVSISGIEDAFTDAGYSRYPVVDDDGENFLVWVKDNHYEQVGTWDDGTVVLDILHDKSPTVRADHMERKLSVLDTVLPAGFMSQLRSANDAYNNKIGPMVTGESSEVVTYGGDWQTVKAEYNASETIIGGYLVRFSLWWWQSTCPAQYDYCYYYEFPGLEFTGDSSLVFYTIQLTPAEDYQIVDVGDQLVMSTQAPTPSNVGIGWEFNTRGDEEGWEEHWGALNLHSSQGYLHTTTSTGMNAMILSPWIEIPAGDFPILEIRMKLNNVSRVDDPMNIWGVIFFITSSELNWDNDKGENFKVSPWSTYKTYKINMANNVKWRDVIRRLRVVPLWGEGNIEIDYIRMLTLESAPPSPTPFRGRQWTPRATLTPTAE